MQSLDHPLIDSFGRVHDSLRISVTDRCNIRCFYCMPETGAQFAPRDTLLTFEEIHRLANLLVQRCGVRDIRITGGEPLVRREIDRLVRMLASIDGLQDLSMTTNGILLADCAELLHQSGLRRVNISLDTLDEKVFQKITRRSGVEQVVQGIDAAIACGFESIKLNTIAIAGITETQIVDLVEFASARNVPLRFIEFMPLDTDRAWTKGDVLSGDRLLRILASRFGTLTEVPRSDPSQPAEEFVFAGGQRVGIIRSVTAPFCGACNRLRLTADGSLRNCLFANGETPLRDLLRDGASDDDLLCEVKRCVAAKAAGHGMSDADFTPPPRPMYAIGG
tara:strand:+ start:111173 stop:112177 length:1005 start_codon:yes stop_codon:yes gene_type:complete